jgi:hypothetical protein
MRSCSAVGGAIENAVGAIYELLLASWLFTPGPNSFFRAMAAKLVRANKRRECGV